MKSFKDFKEEIAEETEMRHSSDSLGDHMALKAYANKLGPKHIDRHDLLTAASHMAFGNMDHLKKHLKALDTDVRDKALEYVARRHYPELGYRVHKEETDKKTNLIPKHKDDSPDPLENRKGYIPGGIAPGSGNWPGHPNRTKKIMRSFPLDKGPKPNLPEEVELDEAIKLGSEVIINDPGNRHHGEKGTVSEIRHGLPGVRPKYYTVDHGGTSSQLPKENLRIVKREMDEAVEQVNENIDKTIEKLKKQYDHHDVLYGRAQEARRNRGSRTMSPREEGLRNKRNTILDQIRDLERQKKESSTIKEEEIDESTRAAITLAAARAAAARAGVEMNNPKKPKKENPIKLRP